MTRVRAILFMVALLMPAVAHAQSLWQNTRAGMSPKEVAAFYPSTTPPTNVNGREVMSTKIDIFKEKFAVLFYFAAHGLSEVTLQATNAQGGLQQPLVTFGLIRDELIAKYGRPVSEKTSTMGIVSEDVNFLSNGVSIKLGYMDTLQVGTKFVSVTYEPVSGGDSPL
jgi:hypothetical protein